MTALPLGTVTLAQQLTLREVTSALPDAPVVLDESTPRRTPRLPRTRRAVAHALVRTATKLSPA